MAQEIPRAIEMNLNLKLSSLKNMQEKITEDFLNKKQHLIAPGESLDATLKVKNHELAG